MWVIYIYMYLFVVYLSWKKCSCQQLSHYNCLEWNQLFFFFLSKKEHPDLSLHFTSHEMAQDIALCISLSLIYFTLQTMLSSCLSMFQLICTKLSSFFPLYMFSILTSSSLHSSPHFSLTWVCFGCFLTSFILSFKYFICSEDQMEEI